MNKPILRRLHNQTLIQMPRSRLGPLAIESKLGDHPSQSSVWRAVHLQQKQPVAVKVFSAPFGGTPEARAGFAAEWEELKKLKHVGIARCYGGGFEESEAYLAHELVEGETLAAQLERRGRLPWEAVLELAEPLVDALEYLHGRGISHGRLQPDKIIIAGLSPVLLDVRLSRGQTPLKTGRPPTVDNLALRPPELIDDPAATSPRGDLYSLGAILYLALTGRQPIDGVTADEVARNVRQQTPPSPASLTMDCPVWLDKLVMQLLRKSPSARPHGAAAVKLALSEVRRRATSRAGVAEHASGGFSPLSVTDQKDRDEARLLLGRDLIDVEQEQPVDATQWHDRPWFLVTALLLLLAVITYFAWPLSEDGMRARAEELLGQGTRSALTQAKISYLEPILEQYPDGEHAAWAAEQIDRVEMVEAEHALSVKVKRNLPLKNEAERLYAEAQRYERFGDVATALDQYRSMITLLADQPEYRPFVNLARRQVATIARQDVGENEAARIIRSKLQEAEQALEAGEVIAARRIWYSIVDLYGNNANVAPLVAIAQDRLAGDADQRRAEDSAP